jgi:hypothetical protein
MMMSDPSLYKDGDEAKKTSHEYKELQAKLKSSYFDWGKLTEEIEKMR